jgi:preprotein translocase subunit SecG
MTTLLLVLQVFIVLLLILVIMLQKTGTDSLAGLAGGGHGVLSSRTTSNMFSKVTVILAIAFIVNSLIIAKIAVMDTHSKKEFWNKMDQPIQLDQDLKPKVPTVPEVPEATE